MYQNEILHSSATTLKSVKKQCTFERFLSLVNIFLTRQIQQKPRHRYKACRTTNIFKISSLSLTKTGGRHR